MTQKLIIDADPGIGDAVAVALALVDPEIDLLAVTATAGRVSGVDATRNLQAIVEAIDPMKWPRLGGSEVAAPRFETASGADIVALQSLNGKTGLGDFDFRVAELHHPHESAKLLVDLAKNHPHEITLLTLGPLTNIELAAELSPDFLTLLAGLVCLGGSVNAEGDIAASAEFNIFANPEAARNILRFPATKTLVPLETSRRAILTYDQFDRLGDGKRSRLRQFLGQVLPYAFRAHHEHLGEEGFRLNEVVALAAATRPRIFERAAMAIDIETSGDLTRGMTVFDRRGIPQWQTNIDVLTEVDPQGVLDYFMQITS